MKPTRAIQTDPEGYQVPTRIAPLGGHYNPYSTYSDSGDPYVHVPDSHAIYGSYGDYKGGCPMCEEPPVWECQCPAQDKKCKKGHIWYVDQEGVPQLKNPHEKATQKTQHKETSQDQQGSDSFARLSGLKVNIPYGQPL